LPLFPLPLAFATLLFEGTLFFQTATLCFEAALLTRFCAFPFRLLFLELQLSLTFRAFATAACSRIFLLRSSVGGGGGGGRCEISLSGRTSVAIAGPTRCSTSQRGR
jgi:hypothetical protein